MSLYWSLPAEVHMQGAELEEKNTFLQVKSESESSFVLGARRRRSLPPSQRASFVDEVEVVSGSDECEDELPVARYKTLDFEDMPLPIMTTVSVEPEHTLDADLMVKGTFWQLEPKPPPGLPCVRRRQSLPAFRQAYFAEDVDDASTTGSDDCNDAVPVCRYKTLDFEDSPPPVMTTVPLEQEDALDAELMVKGTFLQFEAVSTGLPCARRRRSLPTFQRANFEHDVDSWSPSEEDDWQDALPVARYKTLDFEDMPLPVMVPVPVERALPAVNSQFSSARIASEGAVVQDSTCDVVSLSSSAIEQDDPTDGELPVARYNTLDLDNIPPIMHGSCPSVRFVSPAKQELVQPTLVGTSSVFDESLNSSSSTTAKKPKFKTDPWEKPTTLILRNIPSNYTRDMFVYLLDTNNFFGKFDFVYLPIDGSTEASLGFGFVNFVTHEEACRASKYFSGFRQWGITSSKVCEVEWSNPHQGLSRHIRRYRNSSLMHPSVPDNRKPILFRKGVRSPFPHPTRPVTMQNTTLWAVTR